MAESESPYEIELQLVEDDLDEAALEEMTRTQQGQIKEMVHSAELVAFEDLPEQAKTGFLPELGVILVSVLPEILPTLINFVLEWKTRRDKRTVKIKVKRGDDYVCVQFPPGDLSADQIIQTIVQTIEGVGASERS